MWSNLDNMLIEVNREILNNEKIIITIMDENLTRNDVELGYAYCDLIKICQRINNSVDLSVDFISKGNSSIVGKVILSCMLKPCKIDELSEAIPDEMVTVKQGLLKIQGIKAFDLKGGDLIGKQVILDDGDNRLS